MAMTADEAYAEAERRIEEARVEGAEQLDLSDLETLQTLPPLHVLSALWTCRAFVPPQVLVQATFRSKATGLFQPNAECRRRGL